MTRDQYEFHQPKRENLKTVPFSFLHNYSGPTSNSCSLSVMLQPLPDQDGMWHRPTILRNVQVQWRNDLVSEKIYKIETIILQICIMFPEPRLKAQ